MVPGFTLYNMTKAAVLAIMETLASDLSGTNVGASAFCPGPVAGNLKNTSKEVRPDSLKNDDEPAPAPAPAAPPVSGSMPAIDFSKLTMSAEEAGERVINGIRRNDLYIFTHTEFAAGVKSKADAMLRAYPDQPINPTLTRYSDSDPQPDL